MFGYATNETAEYMPVALSFAHKILANIYAAKAKNTLGFTAQMLKSQVTLAYDNNGKINHIDTILVSIQHEEVLTYDDIVKQIKPIICKAVPENLIIKQNKIFI